MKIPEGFRRNYDLCLTNQALFDGYDVSSEEYEWLSTDIKLQLRSQRTMRIGEFMLAHGVATEDLQAQYIPAPTRSYAYRQFIDRDVRELRQLQTAAQHTWSTFFSVYLHGYFREFGNEDPSWRDETNLTGSQIVQAKRAKFESVQPADRVAQARKRAAYLTIAAFAHSDGPVAQGRAIDALQRQFARPVVE